MENEFYHGFGGDVWVFFIDGKMRINIIYYLSLLEATSKSVASLATRVLNERTSFRVIHASIGCPRVVIRNVHDIRTRTTSVSRFFFLFFYFILFCCCFFFFACRVNVRRKYSSYPTCATFVSSCCVGKSLGVLCSVDVNVRPFVI